jgi:hypothetical protein
MRKSGSKSCHEALQNLTLSPVIELDGLKVANTERELVLAHLASGRAVRE